MQTSLPTGRRTHGHADTTGLSDQTHVRAGGAALPAPSLTDVVSRVSALCSLYIRTRVVTIPSFKCVLPQFSHNSHKCPPPAP